MDDFNDCGGDSASFQQPREYLLGGSGWRRRSVAVEEGGRYVPKGGHIVDFSTRKVYSRTKYAGIRTGNSSETNAASAKSKPLREPANDQPNSNAAQRTSWVERLMLRETHDVLHSRSPPSQAAHDEVSETPVQRAVPPAQLPLSPRGFASSDSDLSSRLVKINLNRVSNNSKQQWKPAGPCTPLRNAVVARSSSRSTPGSTKKSTKVLIQPHDCQTCACCIRIRQDLEVAESATRQERAAAGNLRRRLESDVVKLAKDRKDFEAFKEEEVSRLEAAAAEISRKQQRDRLAEGARQRALIKETATQDRLELERLRTELEVERRESGKAEGRHRLEIERLRRQLIAFERENADLKAGLQAAESDRLRSWEESQRLMKELSQQAQQAQQQHQGVSAKIHERVKSSGPSDSVNAAIHRNTAQSSCFSSDSSAASPRGAATKVGGAAGSISASSSSTSPEALLEDLENSLGNNNDMQERTTETYNKSSSTSFSPAVAGASTSKASPKLAANGSSIASTKVITYPNGAVRKQWVDGHAVTLFINGDIKQEYPSGIIEYFFNEVGVWQVTQPFSKVESFYFPNGKVESHLPTGEKHILMPEGAGAFKALIGSKELIPMQPRALCKEALLPKPVLRT